MGRVAGSVSLSLAVVAAAQLLYNPLGHAQEAAAPPQQQPQPQAEPQVQVQGQPGQYPTAAPPPPYAPPYPYAAPYPYAQPYPPPVYGPIVTLRADNPRARLQVMTQLKWQDVCLAPCNVPVHPGGTYRVGGGSIRGSEEFTMPRASGQVVVDAQVGSKVKRGIGIGLTIGGAVSALVGGIVLVSAPADSNDPYGYSSNRREEAQFLGVFYLVIGAVLMAVGIPLSASSTSVQVR
jgi:hypothetical protein